MNLPAVDHPRTRAIRPGPAGPQQLAGHLWGVWLSCGVARSVGPLISIFPGLSASVGGAMKLVGVVAGHGALIL